MADAYGDFNTTLGSGSSNNHSLEGSQRSRVDSLQMLGFPHSQGLEVRNSEDVDVLALDKLKNLNAQCDKPFYLQLTQLVDKLVVAVGQRWEVNSRWRAQ